MLHKLKGVFKSFEDHDVRYVVIGGIAALLHGVPRVTFDLDILIEPTPDNAEHLLRALSAAGLDTAELIDPPQLLKNEVTVFEDFVRIDVQTRTPGIVFEMAWRNKKTMDFNGQRVHVVSRCDLISSKRAAGRPIDLEDVRLLEMQDPAC